MEQTPLPTTRAEEIAGEGPYSVEWSGENRTARVLGPDFMGQWQKELTAVHRCADMNAAYKHGQQDRWIPVSERSPENGVDVLVLCMDDGVSVAHLDVGQGWHDDDGSPPGGDQRNPVTHWMPLPPSPPNPEQR